MNIDDITYQIRGAVFEVSKVLGYGFFEKGFRIARRAAGIISGHVGRV
jgi:hypothetical protein